MPLYLTSSHSSRVRKPPPSANSRRASSSPYSGLSRTKAVQRTTSAADKADDESSSAGEDRLVPIGKPLSSLTVPSANDVLSAMDHATTNMFCQIPERAGMNSTRIAQVLGFQKSLPPVVSLAHVHALMSASSKTEREIAALHASGRVRKIKFAGRGSDMSSLGELLISSQSLEAVLRSSGISAEVLDDFLQLLRASPRSTSIASSSLSPAALTSLTTAGYLVSPSISGGTESLSGSSLVAMPSISRAASGSWAAVGGDAAFENLGGVGAARRVRPESRSTWNSQEIHLSVPNVGPYLRLLKAARTHLLELLGKFKYQEAPLYLLRDRWDGAVDSDSRVSSAKRIRGEFSVISPARTKKWKDLNGMNFDWALEECLGAGLVELFETHSVGLGIRALG